MKLTKLFLILALFSANVFAEGDMPGGGKSCQPSQTQSCFVSNSGGNEKSDDSDDTLISLLVKLNLDFWNLFN